MDDTPIAREIQNACGQCRSVWISAHNSMPHVSNRTDYTAGGLKTNASAAMQSINIAVLILGL
jgi:hypothetical protein